MGELGTMEVPFILGVRTSKGWPAGPEVASWLESFCCLTHIMPLPCSLDTVMSTLVQPCHYRHQTVPLLKRRTGPASTPRAPASRLGSIMSQSQQQAMDADYVCLKAQNIERIGGVTEVQASGLK